MGLPCIVFCDLIISVYYFYIKPTQFIGLRAVNEEHQVNQQEDADFQDWKKLVQGPYQNGEAKKGKLYIHNIKYILYQPQHAVPHFWWCTLLWITGLCFITITIQYYWKHPALDRVMLQITWYMIPNTAINTWTVLGKPPQQIYRNVLIIQPQLI